MKQRHNPDARAYHKYYLNQAGRGYQRIRWKTLSERTWTRKYFRKSVQIGRSFIKERSQTFASEALKTGLILASDVMEGQNVAQARKSKLKSTGQNSSQKTIIGVAPPAERSIKRAAKRKSSDVVRRSYGTHRKTSSVKNGSSTPKPLRIYEIGIGFVWNTTDSDQSGTWLLGANRTAIGPNGPRSL